MGEYEENEEYNDFLENLEFRYDLIAKAIYHKVFNELSDKCKTLVITKYDEYY